MQKIKSEKIEPFSKKEEHNKRNDKNGQKICMIYIYIYNARLTASLLRIKSLLQEHYLMEINAMTFQVSG